MIRNQWYVVLESTQVKGRPIGVTRMGEKLVFWRDAEGKVSCLRDVCPHRGVALSLGKVVNGHLQCPFHGFEYDVSGRAVFIPANGRGSLVPRGMVAPGYPTYEAHGLIWIWWGENPSSDLPAPRFFDNLDERFFWASAWDPWNAHYTRVIENQLDVVHLPFIHYNTIGRGNRTVVDGPVVRWKAPDTFWVFVHNRVDDGRPALKPSEAEKLPDGEFHLEFIFPNLWQNYLGENARILAAFVPVDAEHTLLYLRFYQKFLPLPGLGKLVARLAMPTNLYIAHQDRRVVETHPSGPTGLRQGERLIPGDHPIIEYRRRREELQREAAT